MRSVVAIVSATAALALIVFMTVGDDAASPPTSPVAPKPAAVEVASGRARQHGEHPGVQPGPPHVCTIVALGPRWQRQNTPQTEWLCASRADARPGLSDPSRGLGDGISRSRSRLSSSEKWVSS